MKKLFLHIGFNKTGSTSIQKNLASNAEALQEQGFLYPTNTNAPYMQRWQHVPLAAAVPNRQVPWLSHKKRATLGQAYRSLFSWLETQTFHTLVLSSEAFGGIDMGQEKVNWVKEQLAAFDVTVVAYIRRQDAYFLSTYQEGVKAGGSKPFDFESYPQARGLHFAQRLSPWRATFGVDKVVVRPFAPQLWPEGELFFDFLSTIGADRKQMLLAEPENEGLDRQAVELLRQLNLLNTKIQDKPTARRAHQQNLTLVKSLDKILPRKKFEKQKMQLSSAQTETLRTYFAAENNAALEGSGVSVDEFFPPTVKHREERLLPKQLNSKMLLHLVAHLAKQRG
ncbi:hypothetical protein [Leisingera sp.]|uniref:hypothetical protein n=1 Tax=Leisingera sp. TaxID=1879318 RepID=UPI003A910D21